MRADVKQLLNDSIAGRCLAGYHIRAFDGEELKRDPEYLKLSNDKKRLLDNLIDRV